MRRGWLVAAALLALTGAANGDDASRVRAVTLRNGLQVLMLADPRATAVDVAVWYRAGVRMEQAGRTGTSALVGRLMFQGSKAFPAGEHRRRIEAEGGTVNSIVNPDYSCFYQTLPCEAVDIALALEADRMAALTLSAGAFEAERHAMREEQRRRSEATTLGRALQRLYSVSYGDHPYGRPASGLEADLDRLTLADVEAYYRERYTPENAVLTVVGCIDADATLAAIRRHFEPLPKRSAPPPPAGAIARGERRDVWRTAAPSPLLLASWKGPGSADPESPAFEALSRIVTSGPSSRLQRVRAGHRGTLLLVQGDLDRGREASLLFCMAVVKSADDSAAAEQAVIDEVQRLATVPPSADELDRAKHQLEAAAVFGMQTVRGRAQMLGTAQVLDGDFRAGEKRLERIRALSATDVQRAAARLLQPGNRSVVWVMPIEGPPRSPAPGGGARP